MAVTKQPDVPRRRTRYPLIIAALSVLSLLFLTLGICDTNQMLIIALLAVNQPVTL